MDVSNKLNLMKKNSKTIYLNHVLLTTILVLVSLEAILGFYIINKIRYTPIDFETYMEFVEMYDNGERNYSRMIGTQGPIVYPAGFIYLFKLIYLMTENGTAIKTAQYIFLAIYMVTLVEVFYIYSKCSMRHKVAIYLWICFTSYRVHSLFLLRMFNDCVCMMILYLSITLLLKNHWTLGCIIFSLAASIKMNILLFAPGLLFILLLKFNITDTILHIIVCGITQVIVGYKFLSLYPIEYIKSAFDFKRVFLHKWSVNFKFLPPHIFVDRRFHMSLVLGHICCLTIIFIKFYRFLNCIKLIKKSPPNTSDKQNKLSYLLFYKKNTKISNDVILYCLFVSNFVGIVFARSLHAQFYIWYYHSLPIVVYFANFKTFTRIFIMASVECIWNYYPSNSFTSGYLQLIHVYILYGILVGKINIKD